MNLSPAPDDYETAMFFRLVSENGFVEMGIYPVMYGFRVRAGFVGDMGVRLDWCGGGDWANVERLYSICRAILLQRPESRQCFEGLPGRSEIKPFFNDREFTEQVLRAAGEVAPVQLDRASGKFSQIV